MDKRKWIRKEEAHIFLFICLWWTAAKKTTTYKCLQQCWRNAVASAFSCFLIHSCILFLPFTDQKIFMRHYLTAYTPRKRNNAIEFEMFAGFFRLLCIFSMRTFFVVFVVVENGMTFHLLRAFTKNFFTINIKLHT